MIELAQLESSTRSPLTLERLILTSADWVVSTSSSLYKDFQYNNYSHNPYIAAEMCQMTKINHTVTTTYVLQQLEVMENPRHKEQGLNPPLLPSQLVQISV
jgi:hypothetical protein